MRFKTDAEPNEVERALAVPEPPAWSLPMCRTLKKWMAVFSHAARSSSVSACRCHLRTQSNALRAVSHRCAWVLISNSPQCQDKVAVASGPPYAPRTMHSNVMRSQKCKPCKHVEFACTHFSRPSTKVKRNLPSASHTSCRHDRHDGHTLSLRWACVQQQVMTASPMPELFCECITVLWST